MLTEAEFIKEQERLLKEYEDGAITLEEYMGKTLVNFKEADSLLEDEILKNNPTLAILRS